MLCTNSIWLVYTTDAALIAAAILLVVVMQKTQHDRYHSRHDAKWIRDIRRGAYIVVAMMACFAILTDISLLSVCLLIWSTIALLAVTIAALVARPPVTGLRASSISARWAPLWRAIGVFRNSLSK